MPTALSSFLPEDLSLVSPTTSLVFAFLRPVGANTGALEVSVNAAPLLAWSEGAPPVFSPGYTGSVTVVGTTLTATITPTAPWTPGTPLVWLVTYQDSSTPVFTETGHFAQIDTPVALLSPEASALDVAARPGIYASFSVSAGVPVGVDLRANDVWLMLDGRPTDQATGTSGAAGSTAYCACTPRRKFPQGQDIRVRARPLVVLSGLVYSRVYDYGFRTRDAALSTHLLGPLDTPHASPLGETIRLLLKATLRPRGVGALDPVVNWLIHSSEVGQIALLPHATLLPADLPSGEDLIALVRKATPVWRAAWLALGQPETRDALDAAWKSGHPVEQAAALALLIR